ncbi:hypothetical protein N7G274_000739 [Stereocaulon virgatum]|uniref:SMODS and SLOG-associating 2TM effector domain-containing protein n=1 Tax=Stereocaulon virgatum TaxID=373712 RepID=A0ABR4APM6_9LECA
MSSAISIPNSPLPFGADNASHTAWQRSHSARGSTHRNAEGINQLYKDAPKSSTYPAFIAAAQASDVAQRRASASIAPSSINDVPYKIRKLIKRHDIQLWVLAVMFQLNVVALTIGITLGATSAHSRREGATQVAAIVLGITGFVGMICTLALGWLTWSGRQARARLERKWVDEEEAKETRSLREKNREEMVRANIRERERNLCRDPSVSRGRRRDIAWVLPSFKSLTPSPPPKDSHEADANLPPTPRKGKEKMPELRPTLPTIHSANAVAQTESEVGIEKDGASNYTHYLDLNESSEEVVPPVSAIDKDKELGRASVPTVPELQASASTAEAALRTAPEAEPDLALRDYEVEKGVSKESGEDRTVSPQPVKARSNTMHEPNPTTTPQPTELTNSSILQPPSPTLLTSNPISSPSPNPTPTPNQTAQPLTDLHTALIASFRPTSHPTNITPRSSPVTLPKHQHQHQHPTSPSPTSHNLHAPSARPSSIHRAETLIHHGSTSQMGNTPRPVPPTLGSNQSDTNFLAMIENSGSESGDEDVRAYRREKSREKVGGWAGSSGRGSSSRPGRKHIAGLMKGGRGRS